MIVFVVSAIITPENSTIPIIKTITAKNSVSGFSIVKIAFGVSIHFTVPFANASINDVKESSIESAISAAITKITMLIRTLNKMTNILGRL